MPTSVIVSPSRDGSTQSSVTPDKPSGRNGSSLNSTAQLMPNSFHLLAAALASGTVTVNERMELVTEDALCVFHVGPPHAHSPGIVG